MLLVDHPERPLPRTLLDAPGGFVWWYVDALDAAGDGFVCIWSWGLPFLPGRAAAWRAGTPQATVDAPSVNLAVYRGGKQVAYHLLQVPSDEAVWHDDHWRMGASHLRRVTDASGEICVEGDLTLPVPGDPEPLRATFSVRGPPASWPAPDVEPAADAHRWAPLVGPARATARFTHGDTTVLAFDGTGYHDRNGCPVPLDALGLEHWVWGRLTTAATLETPASLLIFYLSWPTDPDAQPFLLVSRADADGRFRFVECPVTLGPRRTGRFGMRWWTTITLHLPEGPVQVDVDPPAEDGPFYLRTRISTAHPSTPAIGWAELCRPDRVDTGAMRPLVAMCVQPPARPGSVWLPLFSGPRAGRWARLLRWWASRLRLGASHREGSTP
jgi:carotenoid 1,2-hydratase